MRYNLYKQVSNSTPMTHSPKLISKRKKKKNRERRELDKRSDLLSMPRERERSEGIGHCVDIYGARQSA